MMLSCLEATRLLSEAQDRPLVIRERVALRTHIMLCTGCRNFERHLVTLRTIARGFAKGGARNVK